MAATAVTAWANCLTILKHEVGQQQYATWFEPVRPVELNGHVLVIEVASLFCYEYLEENYAGLLAKALQAILGEDARFDYLVPVDKGINNPFAVPGVKKLKIDPQLNPSYTFDTFVEGEANRIARRAGEAVADKPGHNLFNPLLIYGSAGLGKTHLAQAIGNEIKRLRPHKEVLYVSSGKFIGQFQEYARNNAVNDFIRFYELMDALIIDDIQLFEKAEKSQDALFAIFNHLQQTGKQLVLITDKPPKEMEGMQERLLSRLCSGLSIALQAPEYALRIGILEQKMKQEGLFIPAEVVKYTAYNISGNIRELEGAMISLSAQSSLNKKEIDIELAKKALRSFIKTASKEITVEMIQKLVCEYFDVPYEKLLHKTRKAGSSAAKTDYHVSRQGVYQTFFEEHWRAFWRSGPYNCYSFVSNCERPDG